MSHRQLNFFSALQSSTEGIDTVFKSAHGGMSGSFWESYSAMANTQGCTIVLGVAEKSSGLVWEGVPDAAQLRTVLWGQLNDRHKVSANLLRDDDVRTVEDEGRQFVVVNVPRASRLQRPVFVGPNPMTGTYRRADEGDYRCSDDEVRRMLADQSDTPADSQIVEHFGQPDFDPETVRQYRNRFASRAPDHPWLLLDDVPLLTKLNALRRDRVTGLEGTTVAGLLMFGRFQALRDALPGFHVDYRVAEDSPQSGDDFSHLVANSPKSSPQLPPDSPHLAVSSPHLPPELLSLAEPARIKGKLPAAEMQALVLRLCDGRWLTSKELAILLSRDAENLQGRILTGLVKKGLLELRFPDVPNRPDQAYRAVANRIQEAEASV